MKLTEFKSIIEATFTDLCITHRYGPVVNADGTTDSVLGVTPILNNVTCRLSFLGVENPGDKHEDNIPVTTTPKLFFKVGSDIKPGDVVTVTRRDEEGTVIGTFKGVLGLPSVYVTHKEVLFSIEESA